MSQFTSKWLAEREIKLNENHRISQSPVAKPAFRHESLGANGRKEGDTSRVQICITSFRKRLLDADNLCGGAKYFLDCVKYAGLVPDDSPDKITLQVSQVKVTENERTEIEIN